MPGTATPAGPGPSEDPASEDPVPEVDAREARERAADGALLLDVREPDEWAESHVDGARHLPLADLDPSSVRNGPVVVMCRSGRRSAEAVRALRAHGRDDVVNLAGGVLAWREVGFPLVAGSEA